MPKYSRFYSVTGAIHQVTPPPALPFVLFCFVLPYVRTLMLHKWSSAFFQTNSRCDAEAEMLPQALDRGGGTGLAGPALAGALLEQSAI